MRIKTDYLIAKLSLGQAVWSWLGAEESRKSSHRSARAGAALHPVPKTMKKRHTDRKNSSDSTPADFGLRTGQAASCKTAGAFLLQSQGCRALAGGWKRETLQLHKKNNNRANSRAVLFVQSGYRSIHVQGSLLKSSPS